MIRLLIKIAIPVIIGILIYNYFFGTREEKETSRAVFSKTKDLTVSVYDMLKSEKHKFDEGKYDKAMEKLNDLYASARANQSKMSASEKEELQRLENQKRQLQKEIEHTKELDKKDADQKSESLDQKLWDLVEKTDLLFGKDSE